MTAAALLAAAVLSLPFLLVLARRPVLRRLAVRNASRRPREAMLVVAGSMMGAAIITGSFVVGDTMDASVRQLARTHLGPIDEIVVAQDKATWRELDGRLASLLALPERSVDGVLALGRLEAAVAAADAPRAAPRSQVLGVDFAAARRFGADPEATGIEGGTPPFGHAAIGADLARALAVGPGSRVDVFAYARRTTLTVDRVFPRRGIAGFWLGWEQEARNVLVSPLTFEAVTAPSLWKSAERYAAPDWLVAVSNRGGVESGAALTELATMAIDARVPELEVDVVRAKETTLDTADAVGKSFGTMFTSMGSFGVLAGLLLLVQLFVMLAAERKPELGMARAVGMRRASLVGAFATEGWLYALAASLLGAALGIGLGRVIIAASARIFASEHNRFDLSFAVTWPSVASGFALGLAVSIVTILLMSARISRLNIIRAIRDLPEPPPQRRRLWIVLGLLAAVLGVAWTMAALPASEPYGLLLGPALLALGLGPALARLVGFRAAVTVLSALLAVWAASMLAAVPESGENAGITVFVLQGIVLTSAAVTLVSAQQEALGRFLRRLLPGGSPALRLGLAYPLARRSRTGLTVAMYALVVFILTFITTLSHLIDRQVDSETRRVSGGFDVVVSSSRANPLSSSRLAAREGVAGVAPLATLTAGFARAGPVDPLSEDSGQVAWNLTAFDRRFLTLGPPELEDRGRYPTDAAAWRAVLADPRLIIVDPAFLHAGGGPPADVPEPGDRFTVSDPFTGKSRHVTVAATVVSDVLINNGALYGRSGAADLFGERLVPSRAYVALQEGVDADDFAASVQGAYLEHGAEASSIRALMDEAFAMWRQMFQLFQGYLALGLVVGLAGLAVVMVRAVRERRRQIGMLRALGFSWRTVGRSFAIESGFVAVEGTVLGAALALVTLYNIVSLGDAFGEMGAFSVPWLELAILLLGTIAASLLATAWPSLSATRIRPAEALRATD